MWDEGGEAKVASKAHLSLGPPVPMSPSLITAFVENYLWWGYGEVKNPLGTPHCPQGYLGSVQISQIGGPDSMSWMEEGIDSPTKTHRPKPLSPPS